LPAAWQVDITNLVVGMRRRKADGRRRASGDWGWQCARWA